MIAPGHARAVEHLIPLIEDHGLAIAGQTAAAVYGLTARDTSDLLELVTVAPGTETAIGHLHRALQRSLMRQDETLHAGAAGHPRSESRVDVWRVDDVLCAVAMRDDEERPHLSIEVGIRGVTGGGGGVRRTALTPGGVRVATVDQVVAARQVVARWVAAPEDLASAFDVGIATHRVGADLAMSAVPATRRDELATSLERARSLLDQGLVGADFVPRARAGLAEAHQRLCAERHLPGWRSR